MELLLGSLIGLTFAVGVSLGRSAAVVHRAPVVVRQLPRVVYVPRPRCIKGKTIATLPRNKCRRGRAAQQYVS